jgi:hypothetical protein
MRRGTAADLASQAVDVTSNDASDLQEGREP